MSTHATRARWRQVVATLVVIVLAAATLYEAAVALGAISIGDVPGEDAPGRDAVVMAGALSLLGGLVVALASVGVPETITRTVRQLLPLAGASLIVAHGYGFDPYFAPSLRRYSDGGVLPAWWPLLVAAAAVVAAVVSSVDPRTGIWATALVLLICLFTLFFTGTGH